MCNKYLCEARGSSTIPQSKLESRDQMEKSTKSNQSTLRVVAANGIIMALYVAVTVLAQSPQGVQLISEGLNRESRFSWKLMWEFVVGGFVV